MAKVQDLTFETEKFANYAVNGVVTATPSDAVFTATVSVANPAGTLIDLFMTVNLVYFGNATGSTGSAVSQLKRNRDNAVLYQKSRSWKGAKTASVLDCLAFTDVTAQEDESYTYTVTVGGNGDGGGSVGGVTKTLQSLKALYIKK